MNRDIYVPPEGPPQGPGPSPEIYPLMGEENIFKMLSDFYQELGQSSIRPLFPLIWKKLPANRPSFLFKCWAAPRFMLSTMVRPA